MIKRNVKIENFIRKWLEPASRHYCVFTRAHCVTAHRHCIFTHRHIFEGKLFINKCARMARENRWLKITTIENDTNNIKIALTNHGRNQLGLY